MIFENPHLLSLLSKEDRIAIAVRNEACRKIMLNDPKYKEEFTLPNVNQIYEKMPPRTYEFAKEDFVRFEYADIQAAFSQKEIDDFNSPYGETERDFEVSVDDFV
ncbi:hypothetical protein [Candidatus Glomeribacter gigasporarum]|nr:hypothetical protein [Candidatus Glomeribacter gigasporarum]